MSDAPKILGTDSLRNAYPKLNQAIDNANEALTTANSANSKSDDAVATANDANAKSDNTQTQLDAVVNRATDTDAMSRQAAVDASGVDKVNLKQRIDDDYNEVASLLAQNASFPKALGAALDNITDDTMAIQNAINENKKLSGFGKAKVTSINDIYGVDSNDGLKIVKNGVLYNSYANKGNRLVFGIEYLSYFHRKIVAGNNINIVFSGDSTTAGSSGITDSNYKIDALISNLAIGDGFKGITTINRGQPGQGSAQWISTYLSGDLSANPDLLILRWGINDPNLGGTAQSFLTNLRQGLATIRASKPLNQLSIVLMTPNSTSDTAHGRDELWYESINNGIKRASRDYQCCFIDTYAYLQDSRNAGDYMDDPYGIGTHIHPKEAMNLWIVDLLYNTILPRTLKILYAKWNLNQITGTYDATNNPQGFQNGWSVVSGFKNCYYWRENNMRVCLTGVIQGGTTTKGTVLFNLPYVPDNPTFVVCGASNGYACLKIDTSGNVIIDTYSGTWISLEGVSFYRNSGFSPLP